MKNGAQVALGVAGGYFLGRTKKMRLALMLAGMAIAGRGGPGGLLQGGLKSLGAVPEVGRLTGEARSKLLDAGKMAAAAAVSRQIETLSGRLGVPGLDSAGKQVDAAGKQVGAAGKQAGKLAGAGRPGKDDSMSEDDGGSRASADSGESRSGSSERKTKRAGDTVSAGVSAAKSAAPRRSRSRSDDGESQPSRGRRSGESGRSRARAGQGSNDG